MSMPQQRKADYINSNNRSTSIVTGNASLMKTINQRIVFNYILNNDPVSRTEISNKTKLAMPTIMRIVDNLIEHELVIELEKGASSGGRRPKMLSVNENARYFIGVRVSGNITTVLVNLKGKILFSNRERVKVDTDFDTIYNQILTEINNVISKSKLKRKKISGVGLGIPGTKFKHEGGLKSYPFKNWEELDIEEWLREKKFDLPVVVDNVAKMGTIGEKLFGHGVSEKEFVYIFADYGIGMGAIIDGESHYGYNSAAGEIGHTIIQHGGKKCYCGNKGCLEMYAGIPAIIEEVRKNTDYKDYTFKDCLLAQEAGDEYIEGIFIRAGEMLGVGIANVINILNPGYVVIGGSLGEKCEPYCKAAKESARKMIFSNRARETRILRTKIIESGSALGAAALAIDKIFDPCD